MTTQIEALLGKSKEQVIRQRVSYVKDFLMTRSLSLQRISDIFSVRLENVEHLLLTSSIVHGLANKSSDIDTIAILDSEVSGSRMATQVFEGSDHLEVLSFSTTELATAIENLTTLSQHKQVGLILHEISQWDAAFELRRKYLERIINGVSMDGDMPYFDALPALSQVWKWTSFEVFSQAIVLAILAEKAGERRGRIGYAMNALLYLMDVIMSHHGLVFSNKKWYLLRWRRFRAETGIQAALQPTVNQLDRLEKKVPELLDACSSDQVISADLAGLFQLAKESLQAETIKFAVQARSEITAKSFLKNSAMYIDIDRQKMFVSPKPDRQNFEMAISIDEVEKLDHRDASFLLSSIRSDLFKLKLMD